MKFYMSITDNRASFIDKDSGVAVFVDSFDNHEFEVQIRAVKESQLAGTTFAETSEELNCKVAILFSEKT